MKEQHLYEYAVIRVLPRVEREEFINAGVIVFSKKAKFIRVHYVLDESKLMALSQEVDIALVGANLRALAGIAAGEKSCGPIARLDLPSRFRWLTAVRSSVIQTSRPHPGLSYDLELTAKRLFEELVL
ncbi:MAG: DUF3037 domain-containing protein [Bacteroidetes bacterium]|nr:MAG: DUF3037 domain-containing protein [Bacteroidota bacterium]